MKSEVIKVLDQIEELVCQSQASMTPVSEILGLVGKLRAELFPPEEADTDMDNSLAAKVSKILDEYLPPDGVGTQREKLRINLHREIYMLVLHMIRKEAE